MISVLQGYLPFTLDKVDDAPLPQAVVTYLLQQLHNRLGPYVAREDAAEIGLGQDGDHAHIAQQVHAFRQQSRALGARLFAERPDDHALFTGHIQDALAHDYHRYVPKTARRTAA